MYRETSRVFPCINLGKIYMSKLQHKIKNASHSNNQIQAVLGGEMQYLISGGENKKKKDK